MKTKKNENPESKWDKVFSRIKITKERAWKILDLTMVLILGSLTYFFAIEAWGDYRLAKTNMATDSVPIERQPTMVVCLGNPKQPDRRFRLNDFNLEMQYYVVPDSIAASAKNFTSVRLKEGFNNFKDEIIEVNKMKYCYEITTKPVNNYQHQQKMHRLVKMIFPKFSDVYDEKSNKTFYDLFYFNSFHVYFTSQEYSYPVEFGFQTQREETFEVKLRKNSNYYVVSY